MPSLGKLTYFNLSSAKGRAALLFEVSTKSNSESKKRGMAKAKNGGIDEEATKGEKLETKICGNGDW